MRSDWIKTTIGDQATLQRGFDITKAEQRLGNIPVISSGGISSFHDKAAVNGPGVVLGRKGVVGSVYYIESDYWPHDTTLWVKDFHGNDPRFVYYFFNNMAPHLTSLDVGSANPTLNRNHVHPIQVLWPPIVVQRAIADILGTLDDKIELNRQINQTLEQIAQAIFKSWFVDFEPVKAKIEAKENGQDPERAAMRAISGKSDEALDQLPREQFDQLKATAALFPDDLVESELGAIPKGWKWVPFGEVIKVFDAKRVPLSSRERAERQGPYPYYGAASVVDHVDSYLFDGTYILMAEDGTVMDANGYPTTQYVWGKFWVNNHAHILKGVGAISDENILMFLRNTPISACITGAVQLKINQKNMNAIPFLKANDQVHEEFGHRVRSLYEIYKNRCDENKTLSDLRDILLPRLLSGELPV